MWSLQAAAVLVLMLVVSVADAAVRTDGEWRGKAQGLGGSPADKRPSPHWLLPPRNHALRVQYVEATIFGEAEEQGPASVTAPTTATTTTTDAVGTTTELPEAAPSINTPAPEPEAEEVLVLPARIPPVWRPSLLGEQLVGALLRHTATEEFERSHGQYVDSFIHGQPLGFF